VKRVATCVAEATDANLGRKYDSRITHLQRAQCNHGADISSRAAASYDAGGESMYELMTSAPGLYETLPAAVLPHERIWAELRI
jgi:hypothetical protein